MNDSFLNSGDSKNVAIKQRILGLCINEGTYSIAELSKETNTSVPTITKLIGELIDEGYLEDMGKMTSHKRSCKQLQRFYNRLQGGHSVHNEQY